MDNNGNKLKCGFWGCEEAPIGGFHYLVGTATVENPSEVSFGAKILWCKTHARNLKPTTHGRKGEYLKLNELR